MDPILLVYLTLTGLAVGSFLNLNIDRIPIGMSIVSPPSQCDHCQRRLSVSDLVPLLSYLWLRGKCRHCKAGIPQRAFWVEVVTGALFGLVAYRFGLVPVAGVVLVYGSLFIAISVIDLERTIIPDKLIIPGVILAFAVAPFGPVGEDRGLGETFVSIAAGGAVGVSAMLIIYLGAFLVYKSSIGFGFGDVKLGLLIGLVVGFPEVVVSLYFAFLSGGIVAAMLVLTRLKGRRDAIPYGPFLAIGAIAILLVGKDAGWYLDLIR